jgi:hypothetical protein
MQFKLNNKNKPPYNFTLSHSERVQIYINLLFMFVAPFFNLLIIHVHEQYERDFHIVV